jgi:hypothetical protein
METQVIFDRNISTEELMEIDYHYQYSDNVLLDDWKRLCNISEFKLGSQFKPGMKLCQHFCPNFWDIRNAKGMSFAKAWKDPIIMNKVREWGLQGMSKLWLSWIIRAVYMCSGLPQSSFYRPHFSRQIIMMTNKSSGILFDPCAGWGGRMLGTVSTGWKYIGCEPNKETYDNLCNIVNFLGIEKHVTLYNIPAEDMDHIDTCDIVMTSPPYFDLEIYSNDQQNQSYHKFDSYDSWKSNWLQPLVEKSLRMNPILSAWNVMNFNKYDLVGDVLKTHQNVGWCLKNTLGFKSPLVNIRNLKNRDITYIFEKQMPL